MKPRWEILKKLIEDNGYKTIVELGVSKGICSANLLKCCSQIETMYLVDISDEVFDFGLYEDYLVKTRSLIMSSHKARLHVPDNLDLVYVDAEHSKEMVIQDIKDWTPKIRKGGIICGHDYVVNDPYSGVNLAVHKLWGKDFNLEQDELDKGNIKIWWKYV